MKLPIEAVELPGVDELELELVLALQMLPFLHLLSLQAPAGVNYLTPAHRQ